MRRLCEYQEVEIIEANACSDHIHMLVKIPLKLSVSIFIGYLKEKSSLMIFEEHVNLKYNLEIDIFGWRDILWAR